MVNLTSFTLYNASPRDVPIGQFLGFVESAPHLREIELFHATPISGAHNGRLVSLTSLQRMDIIGNESPSLLLDHLVIPVGAQLTTETTSRGPLIEGNFSRSLDNLRNLPNFTDIYLRMDKFYAQMEFTGPNGRVSMARASRQVNTTCSVLESLARFDTSKTQRLKIVRGRSLTSEYPYNAFLPMKHLQTLTLSQCTRPDTFICALDTSMSSEVSICPELQEIILDPCISWEKPDTEDVIRMAAARALGGVKLGTVRIVCRRGELDPLDLLELKKHIWHVEYDSGAGAVNDVSDGSDEEDDEEG
jgi:hypothetical protein